MEKVLLDVEGSRKLFICQALYVGISVTYDSLLSFRRMKRERMPRYRDPISRMSFALPIAGSLPVVLFNRRRIPTHTRVERQAYRFARACLWVTLLAIHSRLEILPSSRTRSSETAGGISSSKERSLTRDFPERSSLIFSSERLSYVA